MKTMTCKELGGPCEQAHSGETADDVIKAQDQHLTEQVEAGDAAHGPAREDMNGRWADPAKGMGWYTDVKERFAALPDA